MKNLDDAIFDLLKEQPLWEPGLWGDDWDWWDDWGYFTKETVHAKH
jgi:hypothetical protein